MRTLTQQSKFTFEEKKDSYGFDERLFVLCNNEYVCHFDYNMTGYKPDFELSNNEGVINHFSEGSKSYCIKKFKESLMEGYINLNTFHHPKPLMNKNNHYPV